MSFRMIKHWLRHPVRTAYWTIKMRGKLRLNIDLGKSQPIDTLISRKQKIELREFLTRQGLTKGGKDE